MGIILPGSGDAAGDSIIVPGGRPRAKIEGETVSYPIFDGDLLYKLRRAQEGGHLRNHVDNHHIVGCADTGFFCCLHCGETRYDIGDRESQLNFVNTHATCVKRDVAGAVGEIVIEE